MRSFLLLILVAAAAFAQQVDSSQVKNKPSAVASDFVFTRTNGTTATANLSSAGAATVTLRGCPIGVNGTDTNHYLRVSGGTGTAESVLITGGTCTSGAASGTVQFTTSNTHTGAWTITSATAGIKEAIVSLGSGGGEVIVPGGTNTIYSPIVITISNVTLRGTGAASVIHNAGTGKAIYVEGTSGTTLSEVNLYNFSVTGTASSGDGIFYFSAVSAHIVNVASTGNGGDGLRVERFLLGTVVGGRYTSNTGWGISVRRNLDGSNSNTIVSASIQYNTAGGVYISQSEGVRLIGGDIEASGGSAALKIAGSYTALVDGVWFEGNTTNDIQVVQEGGYTPLGLSVVNNYFVNASKGLLFTDCENAYVAGNTISGDVTVGSGCSDMKFGQQSRLTGSFTDSGQSTNYMHSSSAGGTNSYWKYGGVKRLELGANATHGFFKSDLKLTSVINGIIQHTIDAYGVGPRDTLFTNLPTPGAGYRRVLYCTDCTIASPCTGSGSGAWAFYNGSTWKCPF